MDLGGRYSVVLFPGLSCILSLQLKLEDRSVVPRDVVRHMRSTVSPSPHPVLALEPACSHSCLEESFVVGGVESIGSVRWGLLSQPCGMFPSSPGQSVWYGDRCQHRLRCQAHWHQLHHLPCQQQGPPAHLGERPLILAVWPLCCCSCQM